MKAPKKSSKRYNEILRIGCGGEYDEWNGDYDCSHGYTWNCEECPIVVESEYEKLNNEQIQINS